MTFTEPTFYFIIEESLDLEVLVWLNYLESLKKFKAAGTTGIQKTAHAQIIQCFIIITIGISFPCTIIKIETYEHHLKLILLLLPLLSLYD